MGDQESTTLLRDRAEAFGEAGADVVARLISAAADLAIVVDPGGFVRDVTVASESLPRERCQEWVGQRWLDIVTIESRPKVEDMLREAAASGVSRGRQVNHALGGALDLPVRYSAVSLRRDGWAVAVGRDMRAMSALQQRLVEAQQSMEREYTRIREAETRYRLLFQLASEAVIIVDAASQRVADANPAASRALNLPIKRMTGRLFSDLFSRDSLAALDTLHAAVRVTGRADDVRARLAEGGPELLLSASLYRSDSASQYLVRLSTRGDAAASAEKASRMLDVVAGMPDGFVIADGALRILSCNPAFLDIAQLAAEEQAKGETLDRWLGRPAVDMPVIQSSLQEHGLVRRMATIVRGEYGVVEDVEVSAVSVRNGDNACLGFTISRQPPKRVEISGKGRQLPRSVEQLTGLVGRLSLKEIVRETTDIIEKLCIEAALEVTNDNRASAAEMLGLSRQGLYSKLRRYGISDADFGGRS